MPKDDTEINKKKRHPRFAKSKGAPFQKKIADGLRETFKEVPADNIRPAVMGEAGEDISLTSQAREIIGSISIECKNHKRTSPFAWFEQASRNAAIVEATHPIVVFAEARKEPKAIITYSFLLELLRTAADHRLMDKTTGMTAGELEKAINLILSTKMTLPELQEKLR
jgi:hypothetical protein